jgi:diaminohydroxyphosphoribosylaminopyrimidine deaminase/5-amino-6-(5-phosphoribosylamino)uracil reductase
MTRIDLDAQDSTDLLFMREALALGEQGLGSTWPNPSVGAVVVRQTASGPMVIARGHTQPGGRPHGEAVAFDALGGNAAGCTLYVTLEPCSHRTIRGGTPCIERTLLAGVTRVVSAMDDPNPRIAGLGHALLRTAGVKVAVGVGADEAMIQHRGHILRVTENRPAMTLKIARTLDGYAGGPNGTPIQVSCPLANDWVHLNRARHDAIMLGIGSVLADDPRLTVRLPGLEHRSPVRVILDSRLRLPLASKLVKSALEVPLWVIATEDAPSENERCLVSHGAEVMRVQAGSDGHLDLGAAMRLLSQRGITRVYSEGGPSVGARLALAGLADEVVVSTSSSRLGLIGVVAIQPSLQALLTSPEHYRLVERKMIGVDTFETYRKVI